MPASLFFPLCVCAEASCFQHARKLLHYTTLEEEFLAAQILFGEGGLDHHYLRHSALLAARPAAVPCFRLPTRGVGVGGGGEVREHLVSLPLPAAGIVNQVVCFKLRSGNSITSCSMVRVIGRVAHARRFVLSYFSLICCLTPPPPPIPPLVHFLFSSRSG